MGKNYYKTKKYNRNIKKGAGLFSNTKEYIGNKTKKIYDSVKSTSSKLASSASDIAKSKYLFSLIVNPGSVHRMLFKNAHFIDFIEPAHIKRLYCQGQPTDCVIIEKGYLYSNNTAVVNAANEAEANSHELAKQILDSAQTQNEIEKNDVNIQPSVDINTDELDKMAEEIEKQDKMLEQQSTNTGFINQTLNRLAFAKLNDAILTDDFKTAESDKDYITFKPGYQPLFEFFATYKHQFNRTIHYGGWDEWAYINKKITEFISLKPGLQKEFMEMIWGTSGIIKLVKSTLDKGGKIADSFKEARKKGSDYLKQFISGLSKEQSDAAAKKNEEEENEKLQNGGWEFPKINMPTISLSSMKPNIPKYRVIRILIKYYDIDPGKYNFNVLKRLGAMKKNYPLFMEREAKKAVQIAINTLQANTTNSILVEGNINKDDDEQSIAGKSLDDLLNELVALNTGSNMQQTKGGNQTERKRHSSKRKRRTLKSNNMYGGLSFDSPFFKNVKMIFKTTYKMMIDKQMVALAQFIIGKPEENLDPNQNKNTKLIAELYAEITRCLSMSTMTLCFTITSSIVGHISHGLAAMPACVLSNVMYMVFLYETRILDYDKISIYEQSGTKSVINYTGTAI